MFLFNPPPLEVLEVLDVLEVLEVIGNEQIPFATVPPIWVQLSEVTPPP